MTRRFLADPACQICRNRGYRLTFAPVVPGGGLRLVALICSCVVMLPDGLEAPRDAPPAVDFCE